MCKLYKFNLNSAKKMKIKGKGKKRNVIKIGKALIIFIFIKIMQYI